MKNILKAAVVALAIAPVCVLAGGDPDHVKFPADYAKTFTQYAAINRANQTQVAKLYANDAAIAGYKQENKGGSGAVIVMEIYTPKKMQKANRFRAAMGCLKSTRWRRLA